MALFEPKNGTTPMWRLVYDLAITRNPGDLITYEELTETLGYDPRIGPRNPIHSAAKHLLDDRDRTLIAVRGQGYRIALATEHYGLARGKQKEARRKISKGIALAVHVDVNELTPRQRTAIDGLSQVLMMQNEMLSRHDKRIATVETVIHQVDDRVAALEGILRTHGIATPETTIGEIQS
jgi:hypothetical protein